jgi:hypothetical protein
MINEFGGIFHFLEKFLGIVGSVIYLIFSLVVVKQVNTMSKNVKDKFNGILITISYIHLLGAIVLIFLALTIL